VIVEPPSGRPVSHPYPDGLPEGACARSYSLHELMAEKLRALGDRCLPRDPYDVVNIHRRAAAGLAAERVLAVLRAKCAHKDLGVPNLDSVRRLIERGEIHAEWDNMLRHQVAALAPAREFVAGLADVFAWLEATASSGRAG